ncbi:MAG: hypothetical protein HS130_12135 [Deltaproteobacteria bacterium]|nr:hypothetical protein [Deltaproteobacteria bacterium]MCL4873443.1 hypothetical protein [bacterium]
MSLKGSYKGMFLVSASVILLAVSGCGGEKKAEKADKAPAAATQEQMPKGHPGAPSMQEDISKVQHANIKTQKAVSISDDVKAKWKEAQLEILDAESGASQTVTVKVGSDIKLKEGVRLKVEVVVPDYTIAESRIESRSNELKNPAVLVDLVENDKSISRGWVFRDYPEFNSYNDRRFPLRFLSAGPQTAKK